MSSIAFLTSEDVIQIHDRLTIDAIESEDPISPPGIKDKNLLESAVSRQHSGYGDYLKYSSPESSAATLCYGICCNHPLHNGNKRTALVAMLCHLDKNGITFNDEVSQDYLYNFMLKVAGHKLIPKKKLKTVIDRVDAEVEFMTKWIKKRTRKISKGERPISYKEFEKRLKQYDVTFENHKGNYVDVFKTKHVKIRKGLFGSEYVEKKIKVANIPYWPNRSVGRTLIKSVRKKAKLTPEYGIDSLQFYRGESTPDDFIIKYKKTLNKLAKT